MHPERLLVPLVAAALGVFGGLELMRAIGPDESAAGSARQQAKIQNADPNPSGPSSLIRPANFAKALATIRKEGGPGARTTSIRVAPTNVQTDVIVGGERRLLVVAQDGTVASRTTAPVSSGDTIPVARIPVGAPARIAAALRARGARAGIDYMVLNAREDPEWSVFLADAEHTHFIAALNGGGVWRPGVDPPPASRGA